MRTLVLVHVFYHQLWPLIAARLPAIKKAGAKVDLLVNCVRGAVPIDWVPDKIPGIRLLKVIRSPNRGLDIGGTTQLLEHFDPEKYELILKLHTKRSLYRPEAFGRRWLDDFLDVCCDQAEQVLREFADPRVSMVSAAPWIVRDRVHESQRQQMCQRLGLPLYLWGQPFACGTMFSARPSVFQLWKDRGPAFSEFEAGYAQDGTLAHTFERSLGSIAASLGELRGLMPSRLKEKCHAI